jgi:hypothetical protein
MLLMNITNVQKESKHPFNLAALPHIINQEKLKIAAVLQELLRGRLFRERVEICRNRCYNNKEHG